MHLLIGYNINNVEILSDFNGWSWAKIYDENYNYIDNLIYQNLLVMLGEKFLYEWRTYGSTRKDFLSEAKRYIKYFSGDERYFEKLFEVLYLRLDSNEKNDVNEKLRNQKRELQKMQDRIKFIDDAKNKRLKLTKKIQKIDLALNDKKILEKEIEKVNLKLDEDKKIKSIAKYKKMLLKEKENVMSQISYLSSILIPANFIKRKDELENSVKFFNVKESFEDAIINWQLEFLKFIDKKLNKINTRDEIIDVIYEIRYYKTLKISKDEFISDFEEIDNYLDKILKKSINKLCKLGAIKIISMDINLNFEIIKYALDTKIIELEKIKLYFEILDDGLIIKVFDKDVFEKQGKKKIKVTNNTLEVKEKRKIKLFN
jgi:hypothetical protein